MVDVYSTTLIKIRAWKYMLTQSRIHAMISAKNVWDAARVLLDCGYQIPDEMLSGTGEFKDDEIIDKERATVFKQLEEFCKNKNLKYCIKAKYEYHNIKVLYKIKRGLVDLNEALYPFAVKRDVSEFDKIVLPGKLAKTLKVLDKVQDITSLQIDAAFTKELYLDVAAHAKKLKNKTFRLYYSTDADYTNLKTALKCKRNGQELEDYFVAGGKIDIDDIDMELDEHENPTIEKLEKEQELALLEITETDKDDLFKENIIFWWFNIKQVELQVIKLILMGKKFGFTDARIRDSIGGLYDRFN
ncbi:MAG: V-type ATPase subunit [Christensenellaceae bacterium]|jgi:vacuolar-type H+-ATPase subunit C/Vma6|nr:V-type ATPase subunit [Christensenellaceae bacterium]